MYSMPWSVVYRNLRAINLYEIHKKHYKALVMVTTDKIVIPNIQNDIILCIRSWINYAGGYLTLSHILFFRQLLLAQIFFSF